MKNLAPPPRTIPCLLIVLLILLSFQRLNAQQWTAFNAMDVTEPVCTITSSSNDSVTFNSISGKKVLGKQHYDKPGTSIYRFNNTTAGYKNLMPGVYLLKVTNNNQCSSQRVIIK